jgi:hypothetical protein
MRLRKVRDVLKQRVEDIENSIIDGFTDLASTVDAERRLEDARTALQHAETKVKAKENVLGVDDRTELRRLTQSIFIATRMNALALKIRLRERLCARKYELDPLERSFRRQKNGASSCRLS